VPRWSRWAGLLIVLLVVAQFTYFEAIYPLAAIWLGLALYAVIYRYRRASTAVERQQLKWVMGGFMIWGVLFLVQTTAGLFFPVGQPSEGRAAFLVFVMMPLYAVSLLALPITIAMAILRYRLWDIDVIIRRTLVYGALTGLLALAYLGSVLLLQALFGRLAGDQSPIIIVASTLVIAALFAPLRRRLQEIIDRRFYRRKYDARHVLARFAQSARDEVELDELAAALVQVVEETMRPERVSLWLREHSK
jgi:hypothetical protein